MKAEIVKEVTANGVRTASGYKRAMGNRRFAVGDMVFTADGYAFGHEPQRNKQTYNPSPLNVFINSSNANEYTLFATKDGSEKKTYSIDKSVSGKTYYCYGKNKFATIIFKDDVFTVYVTTKNETKKINSVNITISADYTREGEPRCLFYFENDVFKGVICDVASREYIHHYTLPEGQGSGTKEYDLHKCVFYNIADGITTIIEKDEKIIFDKEVEKDNGRCYCQIDLYSRGKQAGKKHYYFDFQFSSDVIFIDLISNTTYFDLTISCYVVTFRVIAGEKCQISTTVRERILIGYGKIPEYMITVATDYLITAETPREIVLENGDYYAVAGASWIWQDIEQGNEEFSDFFNKWAKLDHVKGGNLHKVHLRCTSGGSGNLRGALWSHWSDVQEIKNKTISISKYKVFGATAYADSSLEILYELVDRGFAYFVNPDNPVNVTKHQIINNKITHTLKQGDYVHYYESDDKLVDKMHPFGYWQFDLSSGKHVIKIGDQEIDGDLIGKFMDTDNSYDFKAYKNIVFASDGHKCHVIKGNSIAYTFPYTSTSLEFMDNKMAEKIIEQISKE